MKHILLIQLFIICASGTSAQRVALVLSGGGAKGLAHIGVIRALEENNIPIDYIAGTSMGAIVGGLYASGFSTEDMEELFKSNQFKLWSTGIIEEENRYYFTKDEFTPLWLSLKLEKREKKLKLKLPTNLVPAEQMDFAFMELFATTNAACNNDFDRLFVPFLCNATDAYNNKEVEYRSGDVGEAIRASMTFPMFFKPIMIDSALVFDGGIMNNFPVLNVIKAFDPDIIIGSKVANNLRQPDEDDLTTQIENLVMQKTDYEIPPEKGILIETLFTNVNLLDFQKIDIIQQAGYDNAIILMDSIKTRIERRVSAHEVQNRRDEFNHKKPELRFQNILVEGISDPQQQQYIVQSIKRRSNTISAGEFRKEYLKLVATPQIRSMRPVAHYNDETGYFDVTLQFKRGAPLKLHVGGHISTRPINQGFFGVDYHFFKKMGYAIKLNTYFGRFYSSAQLGGKIYFPSRMPFYLEGNVTFNRWDYYATSNDFFFEDVSSPFVIMDETNARIDIGLPGGTRGKTVFGGSYSSSSDDYYIKDEIASKDIADKTDFNAFAAKVYHETYSFDYVQYPTKGVSSVFGLTYVGGKEKYRPGTTSGLTDKIIDNHHFYILKASIDKYFKLNRRLVFGFLAEGVYSNKETLANYRSTILSAPAFTPTPYSQTLAIPNFRNTRYIAGGLKFITKFSDQFHFRAEGYTFTPVKDIVQTENNLAEYGDKTFSSIHAMGLTGLVYHTGFGPVSVTLNYFDNEKTKFYVVASFGYILFNKRGF